MKKINIQNEANIKAKGNLNSKKCKPVICIDTGEVFTSGIDAAEHAGVSQSVISACCLGKIRTANGKRYCYLSRVIENLDPIVTRLRETAAVEEDAKRWKAYQAEQEAIRKEEEKRQAEIAKAAEKVAKLTASAQDLEAKWHKVMAELNEAEKAFEALQDNGKEVA